MRSSSGCSALSAPDPASAGLSLRLSPLWLVAEAADPAIVGRPLADVLGGEAVHELRNQLSLATAGGPVFVLGLPTLAGAYDVAVASRDGGVRMESRPAAFDHRDRIGLVRGLIDRLCSAQEPIAGLVRMTRALTKAAQVDYYEVQADGSAALASSGKPALGGRLDPGEVADRVGWLPAIGEPLFLPLCQAGEIRGLLVCTFPSEAEEHSFADLSAAYLFAHMAALALAARG